MDISKSLLDALNRLDTLIAFVLFVVPGFISLRTYELMRGGEPRKVNDALIDVVVFSFITDVVWLPVLFAARYDIGRPWSAAALFLAALAGFVIFPMALGYVFSHLQERLNRSGAVAIRKRKPWDHIFAKIRKEKWDVGIVITLADGRRIGGRYTDPGLASNFPDDEQLLLGESWTVDQQTGRFLGRSVGTRGLLIDKKDAVMIEFTDWADVDPLQTLRGRRGDE